MKCAELEYGAQFIGFSVFPPVRFPKLDLKRKKHIIEMCLFFGTPIGNRSA